MSGSRRLPLGAPAAVLTFGTGAVDVMSFTRLGEVFSSVMTGNLVLLGLAVARASAPLAVHTTLAFAGYIAGAAVGSRITGPPSPRGRVWPPRVTAVLVVEVTALAAFTAGWVVTDARPDGGWQLALLGLASLGMGLQSAAMRGLGGRAEVSTTYLTGTLTGVVAGLVGRWEFDARATVVLAAAAAGAAAGGGLLLVAPHLVPVLPLAALTVVIATATHHEFDDALGDGG